jgi:hypothetical protein
MDAAEACAGFMVQKADLIEKLPGGLIDMSAGHGCSYLLVLGPVRYVATNSDCRSRLMERASERVSLPQGCCCPKN